MRSNWWILYWQVMIPCFSSHQAVAIWACPHSYKYWWIQYWGIFSKKLPNANKSSCTLCPIEACLFWNCITLFLLHIDGVSESTSNAAVLPCTEDHVLLVVSWLFHDACDSLFLLQSVQTGREKYVVQLIKMSNKKRRMSNQKWLTSN